MRMDSGRDRKRMNVEGDRLSSLPDDLIHKILSFMDIKHAIETSVLSSRWRYVWTSMSCINFSNEDFRRLPKFSKFVKHVLSNRNKEVEVHSVKLNFRGSVSQAFFRRFLDNAFSHNVQQLNITCLPEKRIEIPLSLISSQSVKNFTLTGFTEKEERLITTPSTWKLPALVTLSIHCVTLYDDSTDTCAALFSNCANLKNLTINNCRMIGGRNGFNICHHGLSSLTLEGGHNSVNVDTPQLKNLAISNWRRIHLISTPNLSSLHYKDDSYVSSDYLLKLSTNLPHLEKADICINRLLYGNGHKTYAQEIICLLEQLHIVKYLTLNLELVKLLSSFVELILHQPSPFVNLKSLKIYAANVTQPKVTMSPEVKNYLVDGSPGATFTMVSYEVTEGIHMSVDRSWIDIVNRNSPEFKNGLKRFIDIAKNHVDSKGKTWCPCRDCVNMKRQDLKSVYDHIHSRGFLQAYRLWNYHGEKFPNREEISARAEMEEKITQNLWGQWEQRQAEREAKLREEMRAQMEAMFRANNMSGNWSENPIDRHRRERQQESDEQDDQQGSD